MLVTLLIVLALGLNGAQGLISELELKGDTRSVVLVEDFGAGAGAVWNLTVASYSRDDNSSAAAAAAAAGFLVDISSTLSSTAVVSASVACAFLDGSQDVSGIGFVVRAPFDGASPMSRVVEAGREGYYHTHFVNCAENAPVALTLRLEQYNVAAASGKRRYLGVGEHALVALNAAAAAVYAAAIAAWGVVLRKNREGRHAVHHLMTVMLVLKVLAFAFTSIQLAFQDVHGTRGGWAVPYFGFAMIKGTFLFILVVLLGSGWSIVKPYLSSRDKTIMAVVLPLQIIDNIALVYVEGAAQGAADWASWQSIFRIFDLACCCAILFPVLWSIQHLKQASKTDGKAAISLQKLSIFREFYLIVIVYVYFRVILLYLLSMSLSYRVAWLSFVAEETITAILICIVGYKFRPVKNNPYLKVEGEDDDDAAAAATDAEAGDQHSVAMPAMASRPAAATAADEDKISIAPIP